MLLHPTSAYAACTKTWDGGAATTSWQASTNWLPDGLPGSSDDVCIPNGVTVVYGSGTTTVRSLSGAGSFSVTGGSLTVSTTSTLDGPVELSGGSLGGPVTHNGVFTWSGGTLGTSGTTTTIGVSGRLSILMPGSGILAAGHTVHNLGAMYWDDGNIRMDGGARIDNAGTFELRNDEILSAGLGTPPLVHNTGTLAKTAGTGSYFSFEVALDNDGAVSVSAGQLVLQGGSGTATSSGTYTGSSPAELRFFGSKLFAFAAGAALEGDSVSLEGEFTGSLAVNGTLLWNRGAFSGDGATTTFSPSSVVVLDQARYCCGGHRIGDRHTIVNNGSVLATDQTLSLGADARLVNAGTLDLRTDVFGASGALLRNTGTLRHAIASNVSVSAAVENDGMLEVSAGRVYLGGGSGAGHSSGRYVTSGDGELWFDSNNKHHLDEPATLEGPGHTIYAGILSGSFTVTGTLEFADGSLEGSGHTTTIAPGGRLILSNRYYCCYRYLGIGHRILNRGTMRWDAQPLRMETDAVLENAGTLEVRGDVGLDLWGTNPSFLNSGTVRRTTSDGNFDIGVPFRNEGVLDIASGTVRVLNADFAPTSASTLRVAIGGSSPGAEHGRLVAGQDVTLNGTLETVESDGFIPSEGDPFQIITASSIAGSFDTVRFIGSCYDVQTNPADVTIVAAPCGTVGGTPEVDATTDHDTAAQGDTVGYTAQVRNAGPETSRATLVFAHIPLGTQLAPAPPCPLPVPGGDVCVHIDAPLPGVGHGIHEIVYDLGPMGAGQTITLMYAVKVTDAPIGTVLRNHLHVVFPLVDEAISQELTTTVVSGAPAPAGTGARADDAGPGEPSNCGHNVDVRMAGAGVLRTPQGERDPISGRVHDEVEPVDPTGRGEDRASHQANCAVLVTAGY